MKLFSKPVACICALVMAASTMTAVSVSAEESSGSTAAVTQESSKADNTKYGKVTAVNGSEITVALGEFSKKEKSADGSAVKEKKKTSDDTASADEQQAEKSKKCGKGHKGKGGRHGSFTENGTTVTETVSDSVTVSKKGEEASVSDISEGNMVKLGYNESGVLESVKLMKGHKHGSKTADGTESTRPEKRGMKAGTQSDEQPSAQESQA